MGMHPWHSYQLANALIPVNSRCSGIVFEYAWQSADKAGRDEIRRSIIRAEELYYQYAHYYPRVRQTTATVKWPTLGDQRLTRFSSSDFKGNFIGIQLPDGYIDALGVESKLNPLTCAVVYTDADSDGVIDTATVTYAIGNIKAENLSIEFKPADVLYPDSENKIPFRKIVSTSSTTTITLDAQVLIRPIIYTSVKALTLDPNDVPPSATSAYATQVIVSNVICDPNGTTVDTAQAMFIWETAAYPYWATPFPNDNTTKDPSALAYAIGRAGIRDARQGIVYVGEGVYDSTTGTWSGRTDFSNCRPPDRVQFRYRAGANDTGLDVVIARLAAAELARPVCACDSANKELGEWQIDISRTGAINEVYAQPNDWTNPLGSRRGHIYAWRTIQQAQRLTGILA
jgi:hypothetical protein